MIKHFAKGHQCPSSPFQSFLKKHYIFQIYFLNLISKTHVIVAYEYNIEKEKSAHLVKIEGKKVKVQGFFQCQQVAFLITLIRCCVFFSCFIFNGQYEIFMCEEGGGCYKNLTILYKLIHTPPAHKVQEVNYQEDMILILCPHGINTLSRDDHSVSGWRQKIFTQQVF